MTYPFTEAIAGSVSAQEKKTDVRKIQARKMILLCKKGPLFISEIEYKIELRMIRKELKTRKRFYINFDIKKTMTILAYVIAFVIIFACFICACVFACNRIQARDEAYQQQVEEITNLKAQLEEKEVQLEQQKQEILDQMAADGINVDNPDEFDLGTAPTFPFLNNIFGDTAQMENNEEVKSDSKTDSNEPKQKKRRFLDQYCTNLTKRAKESPQYRQEVKSLTRIYP